MKLRNWQTFTLFLGLMLSIPSQTLAQLSIDENSSTFPNNNSNINPSPSPIESIRRRELPLSIDRSRHRLSIYEINNNSSTEGRLFERREQRRHQKIPTPGSPCFDTSISGNCNF